MNTPIEQSVSGDSAVCKVAPAACVATASCEARPAGVPAAAAVPVTPAGVAPAASGSRGYRACKRTFDVAFSLCVVVLGALPMALLCAAVRLESPGSPLYAQQRVGRGGRPMRIWKLRSMVADADDVEKHLNGEQLAQWRAERKVDDDPRVTRMGRFIRATSLDELPQFWNVLTGDMSVIGPRPITRDELAWLGEDAAEYLSVRGGITGLWQTTSRNDATWESGQRQAIELEYVRNRSFAMDWRVFCATFGVMFGKGRTGR